MYVCKAVHILEATGNCCIELSRRCCFWVIKEKKRKLTETTYSAEVLQMRILNNLESVAAWECCDSRKKEPMEVRKLAVVKSHEATGKI